MRGTFATKQCVGRGLPACSLGNDVAFVFLFRPDFTEAQHAIFMSELGALDAPTMLPAGACHWFAMEDAGRGFPAQNRWLRPC